MKQKITVIIPILSEFDETQRMISHLESQTLLPNQVIFVRSDVSGSIHDISSEKFNVSVINNLTGRVRMPGESRNAGIDLTPNDSVIAFLDMGTWPEKDWLESQLFAMRVVSMDGILGKCRFLGFGVFGQMTCALSAGMGRTAASLPGSVVNAQLCRDFGLFPEALRAGEDLIWRNNMLASGKMLSKGKGLITYDSFSNNPIEIFKKWFIYSRHLVRSGRGLKQLVIYTLFMFMIVISFVTGLELEFLGLYLFARGVIHPSIKSRKVIWFRGSLLPLMLCPAFAFCLDISKMAGLFFEFSYKLVCDALHLKQG